MYSKLKTCILEGLSASVVDVEADLANGMPQFNIVGLADMSIKESKERVRTAISNSGYPFPLNRITINLAPANLRKEGSQLDLSIAVSILKASNVVEIDIGDDIIFLGELSLDGSVNSIEGALPMIISMRKYGINKCIVPYENRKECAVIRDMEIIPVKSLSEVVNYLNGEIEIEPYTINENYNYVEDKDQLDFRDIKGQLALKRAMEIAAAGFHNMIILGPPGSGKTMAAKRLPSILPDLNFEEAIETTKIYSVSGLLSENRLMKKRPFRSPHHTASAVSLIGGGTIPKPGEISLAHNGVLFLDEIPEFSKHVLEVLRQPLEEGSVTISRASATLTYPSNFLLIGALNPCPCGHFGDPLVECTCSTKQINNYLNKLSSPLLDRIDIHIEVSPVKYEELDSMEFGESSEEIKKRVERAREMQNQRFLNQDIFSNSQIKDKDLDLYCKIKPSSRKILKMAFKKYNFSARTYNKLLKIARTIADLEGSMDINDEHILESIQYRSMDKKYW